MILKPINQWVLAISRIGNLAHILNDFAHTSHGQRTSTKYLRGICEEKTTVKDKLDNGGSDAFTFSRFTSSSGDKSVPHNLEYYFHRTSYKVLVTHCFIRPMGPASLLDISLYVIFGIFDQFRIYGRANMAYVVHLVSDRFDPVLARLNAGNHLP